MRIHSPPELLSHRQHPKSTSRKHELGLGLLTKKGMVAQGKDATGGYGQSTTRLPSALHRGCSGVPRESLPMLAAEPALQPLRPSTLQGTQYVP